MRKQIFNIKFNKELDPYDRPEDLEDLTLWTTETHKARLESFGEQWQYMSVSAEASIVIGENNQTIWGGGVAGIESDVDEEYLKEYKIEAFDDLKEQLKAIGFKDKTIESFRQSYMESSE